ncbi:hypothetical protein JTB14_007301 [Gonioctena quinquepunctata]|nr:hypothetical protein JTB14_007301 [Gonioctena quinquepunctata]
MDIPNLLIDHDYCQIVKKKKRSAFQENELAQILVMNACEFFKNKFPDLSTIDTAAECLKLDPKIVRKYRYGPKKKVIKLLKRGTKSPNQDSKPKVVTLSAIQTDSIIVKTDDPSEGEANVLRGRRYCSVPGCNTFKSRESTLHLFPKQEKLREKWRKALRTQMHITKYMGVCSKHFTKRDFVIENPETKVRRLKRSAIPSQNLPRHPRKIFLLDHDGGTSNADEFTNPMKVELKEEMMDEDWDSGHLLGF